MHDETAPAHGDHEIALAAKWLADAPDVLEQRLMREQGDERDRRRIELVEAAIGL
jgi:hypothetical protein